MRKRFMYVLLLVLPVLLTMTGCCGIRYQVEISENGGSVVQSLVINKEMVDQMKEQSSQEDTAQTQPEDMDVSICQISGADHYQVDLHSQQIDSLAALTQRLNTLSLDETSFWLEEGITQEEVQARLETQEEPVRYILRDVVIETDRSGITVTGWVINRLAEAEGVVCILDLKFPGTITEHTLGEKLDDNTLRIDLGELWATGSDVEFTVRAKLPASNGWILGVAAVCAAAGCFVLYRKRQGRKAEENNPIEEHLPEETSGEDSGETAAEA